ncbi:hypothetical protein J416_05763 [Gracilibacillus halophilus YIM-C55.5]|uniref:SAM-dependent methyltransferase n=1 Tax=Gracilibacillus halophilus YIM-C55.5 TaxID=1308866 RepID=N4WB29_9BACI|nr:tRNA (adenine(22)-N(1))-methyltransferase TrmK [Gracilibacillus halophilus]ENH97493.1 hypothetical protein J416_05763 [Gracilibacillus halophilus YIM-C55.5]
MLSNRLRKIAHFLDDPIRMVDIGSDHAYLPIYICQQNLHARAIAGEVNQGPFQRAKESVHEAELTHRIDVRHGNGLDVIVAGEVRQVTIAGMGGKLIREILEKGKTKLKTIDQLILQPNIDANLLRQWLFDHDYALTDEVIIEEDGYIYEILVAHAARSEQPYPDDRFKREKYFYFGPYLLQASSDVFIRKWKQELEKLCYIRKQMERAKTKPFDKIQQIDQEIQWIKEVVD